MDQHSIRKKKILNLLLSSLFLSGFFATPNEVNAKELSGTAQSSETEDVEEDDEDC